MKLNTLPKNKKRIITLVLLLTLFLILGGAAGTYLYYGYEHRNEFFQKVTINDMKCGGLTVADVEEQIRAKAEDYSLTVTTKDDQSASIQPSDIDYHYVSDGSVQKLMDEQKWWMWYKGYLNGGSVSHEVAVSITYDKEKLKALMNTWPFMIAENQTVPVDSTVVYQDGEYVVTPSVEGNQITADTLYTALCDAVDKTTTTLAVADTDAYVFPKVTETDEILIANAATLNTTRANITHDLPDGTTMNINTETISSWLSTDESGKLYRDDTVFNDQIADYVQKVTNAVAALNTGSITFTGANNVSHTVSSSMFSWQIDAAGETQKLLEEINNNIQEEREPIYSSSVSNENGGLGNTFVEVDLTNQHLWYHKDGQIIVDSAIVTGTYNDAESRTPGGVFQLYYKETNRVLRGTQKADGSYAYESPVNFWMPFNGGIGFHDASWRTEYGGSIFLESGSHGCVNMPYENAKKLYDNIEAGCNIVCYYTDDPNTLTDTQTTSYTAVPADFGTETPSQNE